MDNNQEDNQSDNKAGFKPASNPFLSKITGQSNPPQEAEAPVTTDVEVGGKATTLVGNRAESKQEASSEAKPSRVPEEILYQWQAPEFAYTDKPGGWYLGIFAFFIGLAALAFFFIDATFQKWTTIVLLLIMAAALSVWARRKPKIYGYMVTNYGITVNQKKYSFDDFRACYEYMDYNQPSLDLVPSQRFGTLVSLPLATPEAEDIKETISHMVPKIEHNEDIADKLFRRLRF